MNIDPQANEDTNNAAESLFALTTGKNEEEFPVLKAFQKVLDQERERARHRVVVLSVSFIAALVVVVVLFGILFAGFFGNMMRDRASMQEQMLQAILQQRLGVPAQTTPAQVVVQTPSSDTAADSTQAKILELLTQLTSQKNAPEAAPAAPTTQPAAPAAEAPKTKPSAPAENLTPEEQRARKTGIYSTLSKKEVLEKHRKEEEERKARAKARRAEQEKHAKAEAEKKQAEQTQQVEAAKETVAALQSKEPERISIRPVSKQKLPEGSSSDNLDVINLQGQRVPLRMLLPGENL